MDQLSHLYKTWKTLALTILTFFRTVISLIFNTLSTYVITFLPRSKGVLISWLHLPSAVILEPKERKSVTAPTLSPSLCHKVMGPDALILDFWILSFKPAFSLTSFTLIKRLLVPLCFLPLEWYHLHIWGCYFSWQSCFQLVIHPALNFTWCTLHRS